MHPFEKPLLSADVSDSGKEMKGDLGRRDDLGERVGERQKEEESLECMVSRLPVE
jgi:hypothetical protein